MPADLADCEPGQQVYLKLEMTITDIRIRISPENAADTDDFWWRR